MVVTVSFQRNVIDLTILGEASAERSWLKPKER